jgi:small subunit ribosomal protein S18
MPIGGEVRGKRQAKRGNKKDGKGGARRLFRKKVCRFCIDKAEGIDFKDVFRLQKFVTEKGKIVPRRISGNCTRHQRFLARAIKRARQIALMPFTGE